MHKKLLVCVCAVSVLALFGCNESKNWKKSPVCGNQVLEIGEECDVTTDKSCASYDSNKTWEANGRPGCNTSCHLTIGTCVEKGAPSAGCGNGILDANEACDGTQFANASETCETYLGAGATGYLTCLNCKVTTTGCVASEKCGNGDIDEGEKCDGTNFGTETCASLVEGATGGDLSCISCTTIDTTGCKTEDPCGNGDIDEGEECDGDNLGNATCEGRGPGATGTVKCNSSCKLDYSECLLPTCGDGQGTVDAGEACDGTNLNDKTCAQVVPNTEGTLSCDNNCNFVTSECTPLCGNGHIDEGEACDKNDFGDKTCHSEDGMSIGGELTCNADCTISLTQCLYTIPECGNNIKEGAEACDGDDIGNAECPANTTGTPVCKTDCTLDMSETVCLPNSTEYCGDGIKNGSEECDDTDIGNAECPIHTEGTPVCKTDCTLDMSETVCEPQPYCGDGIKNGSEACDNTDIGTAECPANTVGTPVCKDDCTLDMSETVCQPIPVTCNNDVLDEGEACDPSVLSYKPIACAVSNTNDLTLFAVGSISCSNLCTIVEDCTEKSADDFIITKYESGAFNGKSLLSAKMAARQNAAYVHMQRGMTWNLGSVDYNSTNSALSFYYWYDGVDGAPNLDYYIQHELLKTPKEDTAEGSIVAYGQEIIDNFDYIAISVSYRRLVSTAPKNFALTLYDGEEFIGVLKKFGTETTNFASTGQVTFSIKGMTNPIVRINSYETGGAVAFKDFEIRGLKNKD